MQLSIPGLIVAALLLIVGSRAGKPALAALMLSLPFGATAWCTLPALGGSSPQIYTLFAIAMLSTATIRPGASADFRAAMAAHWALPLLLLIAIYGVLSGYLLPRLFQGQTSAFVPIKGAVFEVPLSPVSGNITQGAYLVLGVLCCLAVAAELCRTRNVQALVRVFLAWCTVNAALGFIDFACKVVGIPDIFEPIRTASYQFLTVAVEQGFWRIAAGFSEASGFAAHTLACVGFTFAYWRETGSRPAAVLCAANTALLLLSTSSTAYVALAVLCLPLAASVARSVTRERVGRREIGLVVVSLVAAVAIVALIIVTPKLAQPILDLLDSTVLRKSSSLSGEERSYWNRRSIESLFDTYGLGVGLGSSRASSWIVAVVSQLGLLGAAAFAAILFAVYQAPARARSASIPPSSTPAGLIRGARAGAFATIVGNSLSAGSADPGIVTFLCFAAALVTAPALRPVLSQTPRARQPSLKKTASPIAPGGLAGHAV